MHAIRKLAIMLGWALCLFPTISFALPNVLPELTRANNTTLILNFSSAASSDANTETNYTLTIGGIASTPSDAVLDSSGISVTLTVPTMASLIHGATVVVEVNASVATGNRIATYTVDAVPAAFSFTAVANALTEKTYESDAVQIGGINTTVAVGTVSGSNSTLKCAKLTSGETAWSVFGACTSVTLNNGDQIKLQLKTAATYSTAVSGAIVIGGVSATFSVTTLSAEAAAPIPIPANAVVAPLTTSLSTAISSPPSSLYLSSNGVVVVPASTTGTISLLSAAPVKTAFWIQAGATANFTIQGVSLSVVAASDENVLAVLRNFKLDNYTNGLQTLEIIKGRATLTAGQGLLPVASLGLGTETAQKQVGILSTANSQPSIEVKINDDSSATLGVKSGSIALRTASADSTIAVTDGATPLYANEVANLSTAGAVTGIRIGSLDDNGTGVGDPLEFSSGSIISVDIDRRVKIPRLGAPLARINGTDTLLEALFDAIGLRSNLARGGQTSQGIIPLLIGNLKYYFMPFGDVIVDTARTDGVVLTSDGVFEVTRKGVMARFRPTILDTAGFATSMGIALGANVGLGSSGMIEIAQDGDTLLMVPEMFTQAVAGAANGIAYDENGYLTYTKNGERQRMLPAFYDSQQLETTFADLAETIGVQDNLDGTVTATLSINIAETGAPEEIVTTTYVLAPEYRVISPFAIPVAHNSDPWWIGDDGLFYFKYGNRSAQGFSIR